MNGTRKYVVSTTLDTPTWQHTTVLGGGDDDVVDAVTRLKQEPGRGILVNGSATLVGTLLREGLVDELRLFVIPVLGGPGGRFPAGDEPLPLELVASRTYSNGVVSLTYTRGA